MTDKNPQNRYSDGNIPEIVLPQSGALRSDKLPEITRPVPETIEPLPESARPGKNSPEGN